LTLALQFDLAVNAPTAILLIVYAVCTCDNMYVWLIKCILKSQENANKLVIQKEMYKILPLGGKQVYYNLVSN
jgi:hypothetical protein